MRVKEGKSKDFIHMNIIIENALSGVTKEKQITMVNDVFTLDDQVKLQLSPIEDVIDGWTY